MKRIGYQGVPGAFSEMASHAIAPEATLVPCSTVAAMFAALELGGIDYAMTALENRIAGAVPAVLAALPDHRFYQRLEYCQPIRFHAWGQPGARLADITEARSHEVALAQCGAFLRRHGIKPVRHEDTAAAAQELAAAPPSPHEAALASERAGALYGLARLAADVADRADNYTRFVLLGLRPHLRLPCGRCVTLLFAEPKIPDFRLALTARAALRGITVTRCDAAGVGWLLDLDSPTGAAAEAFCAELTATARLRVYGHCAPCALRRRQPPAAGWFRLAKGS